MQVEVGRRGHSDGAPVCGVQERPANRDIVVPPAGPDPMVRRAVAYLTGGKELRTTKQIEILEAFPFIIGGD